MGSRLEYVGTGQPKKLERLWRWSSGGPLVAKRRGMAAQVVETQCLPESSQMGSKARSVR